jgi:hypothetical protein
LSLVGLLIAWRKEAFGATLGIAGSVGFYIYDFDQGALCTASAAVAAAVVREVNRQGAGREIRDDSISQCVRDAMWRPEYLHKAHPHV